MCLKNVKQILSLLLALCMCISVFALPVAAEEATAVQTDEEIKVPEEALQQYEVLNDLGVVKYSLTKEMYAQNVTHTQMVSSVIDLFGDLADYFSYTSYTAADINGLPEAAKIQLAYDLKLISPSWMFEPERAVTVGETIKILLAAMGYAEIAEDTGKNMLGYVSIANRIGLLDGFTKNNGDTLVWTDYLHLLYNAIDTNIAKVYGYSTDGYRHTASDSATLLNEYFDIYTVEGVVNANENTYIDFTSVVNEGEVKVGQSVLNAGDTDVSDMLGYYIRGYAKKNDSKYTLLTYYTGDYDYTWELDADILIPNHSNWSAGCIVYEDEKGRAKYLSFNPKEIAVVYNGSNLFEYTPDDLAIDTGSITAIDNDMDRAPEVIIISEYSNYIVDSVDLVNEVIYCKGMEVDPSDPTKIKTISLDLSAAESSILSVNNDEYPLNELSENAVISVEMNKDRSIIKGVVSKDKRSGIMTTIKETEKDNNGNDVIREICIDNVQYKISKSWDLLSYSDKCSINNDSLGKRYVVYLDKNGEIAFFIEKKSGTMYGFLYGCKNEGVFSDQVKIRVFTEDGTWNEYYTRDKIKVFDSNIENVETVNSGQILKDTKYGVIGKNGNKVTQQIIKFSVDENNEVTKLYTVVEKSDVPNLIGTEVGKEILIREASNKNLAYRKSGVLGDFEYGVAGDTRVISTPHEDNDVTKPYEYDAFESGGTGMMRDDFTAKNIDLYDKTDAGSLGLIVYTQGVRGNDYWDKGAYLVKNVVTEMEDGIEYIALECINKGNDVVMRAVDESYLKNINVVGENKVTYVTDVASGDIVTCHTNNSGLIDGVSILFDSDKYTKKEDIPDEAIFQSVPGRGESDTRTFYGTVRSKNSSHMSVDNGDKERTFPLTGTSYIYSVSLSESGDKKFTKISSSEIPVGAKVMVYARSAMMQLIVCFVD